MPILTQSFDLLSHNLPKAVAVVRHVGVEQKLLCTGIPLTHRYILTAGHCLPHRQTPNGENDSFRISVVDPSSERISVTQWSTHPRFKATPVTGSEDFDLAVLQTDRNLATLDDTNPSVGNQLPVRKGPSPSDVGEQVWLFGFSPVRLGDPDPLRLMQSTSAWSQLKIRRQIPQEGKFFATTSHQHAAACAGDSGAPVWSFSQKRKTLLGMVIQANCEKGDVKLVDLSRYTDWIQTTVTHLSSIHPD